MWSNGVTPPLILTLGTRCTCLASRPVRFSPNGSAQGTHSIGQCVGPRDDLYTVVIPCLCWELLLQVVLRLYTVLENVSYYVI